MSSLVKLDALFRTVLEFLRSDHGKGVKYHFKIFVFWLITFEVRELQENNLSLFVELNEMHIPTTFHADRRPLMGLKV